MASQWLPDLILIDVMMPEMDGPATLAELRRTPDTATIPVVFMTARVQPSEVRHLKELGAIGVIAKPFDPMLLAGIVRSQIHAAADLQDNFVVRLREDVRMLLRPGFQDELACSPRLVSEIQAFARGLEEAAGVLGVKEIVCLATDLSEQATKMINGTASGLCLERMLCDIESWCIGLIDAAASDGPAISA
jgi:CheY-like chemotaxis protein